MMRNQSCTPNYNPMPGGSEAQRSTENIALRGLPGVKGREFDAVDRALDETRRMKDGELRVKLIDLVFWSKTHTLDGASLSLHVSEMTGRRWHTDFIRLVGKNLGLLDEN